MCTDRPGEAALCPRGLQSYAQLEAGRERYRRDLGLILPRLPSGGEHCD